MHPAGTPDLYTLRLEELIVSADRLERIRETEEQALKQWAQELQGLVKTKDQGLSAYTIWHRSGWPAASNSDWLGSAPV